MKENDIPLKKPYLPPKLVTVAFKVEDAFVSGPQSFIDWIIPSSSSGLSAYGGVANENSFFDADLPSSFSTSEYGGPGNSWEPF